MNALRNAWLVVTLRGSLMTAVMTILVTGVVLMAVANLWSTIPLVSTLAEMASDHKQVEILSETRTKLVELFKTRKSLVESQIEACRISRRSYDDCDILVGSQKISLKKTSPCKECQNFAEDKIEWDGEAFVVVKTPSDWYQAEVPLSPIKPLVESVSQRLASEEHLLLVVDNLKNSLVITLVAISVGGVVICVGLMIVVSRRMRRNFAKLREFIKALARGSHEAVPSEFRTGGELALIAGDVYGLKTELTLAQKKLREADRMAVWQTMARKVAHEIKNPLTPIGLAGEQVGSLAAKMRPDAVSGTLLECSRIIGEEISSMSRMVKEFTAFARLPKPQLLEENMVAIVQDFVARNKLEAGPNLVMKNQTIIEANCLADKAMIHQILHNLTNNARLAVPDRKVTVTFNVQLLDNLSASETQTVVVDISDDGPGVPPSVRDSLFEAYVTTRSTGESEKGMGLGLAISRQIAMDHSGWLDLFDTSEAGTTMRLSLPVLKKGGSL